MEKNNNNQQTEQCNLHIVIGRFFEEMAEKHNVKVDALNLNINGKTLYVQEYQYGAYPEFRHLECFDLNAI